ncbi:DUF6292 family protein [Umezawaea endophytica]|uniref:DUF6292 family protein n=1 Tax=Umezawaea endophytica TaxID=1654476 RepID=A0A9X2VJG9_9PSEU|nr:DUF6292 family protein [Umezawaea endophytica]MCS7477642.1 DUF6292 family protein [Umezawaea endophytica]
MDVDFDDTARLGLRRYVRLVTEALGMTGESSYIEAGTPAQAYLAVDGWVEDFPDRDVALLWSDEDGWSAAVETRNGEDLFVVARMGGEPTPPPHAVAQWATAFLNDEREHRDEQFAVA